MAYRKHIVDRVQAADLHLPGVRLGAACIEAQIPVQIVARWFGVTRQGVYYWFLGETAVAEARAAKVEQVTKVLLAALRAKALPAKDLPTALEIIKQYKGKR